MGMTFQAFWGSSGAQIAFTILSATSIGDTVTQCTAHERGVANAVKVGQNHFFLENKVVINFNFRHGAKKSGQSGHSFRSYGFFQWKSKMKEFTNVTIPVTSSAIQVNLLLPSWISWPWAWFEAFSQIFSNHFHPERVVSFKERAERGWKSGARSLSWKSGWKPCTLATTRSWIYPKTFFRFRERSNWKFP